MRIYQFNLAAGEIVVITCDTHKEEVIRDSPYVRGRTITSV